jgi:hypothetical protein
MGVPDFPDSQSRSLAPRGGPGLNSGVALFARLPVEFARHASAPVLAAHVSLELMDCGRLRPANDVECHRLVGLAAETFDFEVRIAAVEGVTEDRGAAPALGKLACAGSRQRRRDDPRPCGLSPPNAGRMRHRLLLATWCPCPIKARAPCTGNRAIG